MVFGIHIQLGCGRLMFHADLPTKQLRQNQTHESYAIWNLPSRMQFDKVCMKPPTNTHCEYLSHT
jgi:hypothetical protein